MNTYKTSDLIRLYTCKSKLVSVTTKTGLLRNRKPTLAEVLVYAVIKMKEKQSMRHPQQSFTFHTLPYLNSHLCSCSGCINAVTAFLFLFIWKFNGNAYLNH